MNFLVADSLYCPEAFPFGHLDSYSHYLREAGHEVAQWELTTGTTPVGGWSGDVIFALDRYDLCRHAFGEVRIAQVAAICNPMPWDVRKPDGSPAYDCVISSIPWMVEEARAKGCRGEYMPLAFDTRARVCGMGVSNGIQGRDIPLLFCGTRGGNHQKRDEVLTSLGDRVTVAPPTFGRDYFRLLARSKAVLNIHAEWSRGVANNMRLFEATGMGCEIITDGDLLNMWRAVKSDDVPGAAVIIDGQAMTLQHHTYESRIPRLVEIAKEILDSKS